MIKTLLHCTACFYKRFVSALKTSLKLCSNIYWLVFSVTVLAMDITVESVCQFIIDHGGKVKNTTLVSNFKKVLNDPTTKG